MAVDLNYGIGVEGKNLVLKTLGRVYIKVKDRKYELVFRPEDLQKMIEQYGNGNTESTSSSNITFVDNSTDVDTLEYPGDNTLIISRDGYIYYTQNNIITQLPLKFSGESLTVNNLTVSGQITFTGSQIPFLINNQQLITNLNADLLDGFHATDFAVKTRDESIDGNWTFNGLQTFNTAYGNVSLSDPAKQKIFIDFQTGNIVCNTISANQVTTPEQTSSFSLISGIGQESWIGVQFGFNDAELVDASSIDLSENFTIVSNAYENSELPAYSSNDDSATEWSLDFWYSLFFSSYNEDTYEYTLKNFNDQSVWNSANANFTGTNYNLNQFQSVIDGLRTDIDSSSFTGPYYLLSIPNNVSYLAVVPNMIVKDNLGCIARIVMRNESSLYIQLLNDEQSLNGDQLIVIGTFCRQGGIKFSSQDPSLSILKDVLDETSAAVYFGQLSKIDNTKSGIGMILKGTYPTNLVPDNTIDNIRNYQHTSEINIENSYLKWGDNVTIFNEDGSGYLSKGQIRWSSNNDLIIDGSDIANSRINNTGITNSSFQSGNILINTDGSGHIGDKIEFNTTTVTKNTPMGPAGGDLTGNYPNPTINNGAITTNKIANGAVTSDKIANSAVTSDKLSDGSVTTNKIVNGAVTSDKIVNNAITSDKIANSAVTIAKLDSDVINRFTTIETDINTIESNISNLQNDVSDLQNTVADLSSTVDSHTTSISNIGNTLSSHAGSISNLQLQVSGQGEDITDLEQRVTILENTVGTLNTTLENRLNGN